MVYHVTPKYEHLDDCIYELATTAYYFFFFNDTATTEIYTLSLHDALPISMGWVPRSLRTVSISDAAREKSRALARALRSEEHTSELQSRSDLVCRLLLEKKKK